MPACPGRGLRFSRAGDTLRANANYDPATNTVHVLLARIYPWYAPACTGFRWCSRGSIKSVDEGMTFGFRAHRSSPAAHRARIDARLSTRSLVIPSRASWSVGRLQSGSCRSSTNELLRSTDGGAQRRRRRRAVHRRMRPCGAAALLDRSRHAAARGSTSSRVRTTMVHVVALVDAAQLPSTERGGPSFQTVLPQRGFLSPVPDGRRQQSQSGQPDAARVDQRWRSELAEVRSGT